MITQITLIPKRLHFLVESSRDGDKDEEITVLRRTNYRDINRARERLATQICVLQGKYQFSGILQVVG